MPTSLLSSISLSLLALISMPLLRAHSVWIEDTPDGHLVVRFGEVGGKVEKSPGFLDGLLLTAAWTANQDGKPVVVLVEKKDDHYLLGASAADKPVLGETNFYVMQHGKRPAIWPNLYVRWHPVNAPVPVAPALTLDLIPTANHGEVQVFFRGQPLPGAVVKVLRRGEAEGEEKKLTADAEGRIRFTPEEPGLVVLTCNHREESPGYTRGKAYALASHTGALSWRRP